MKIGDLVISEWTHDGKIRIYHADNEKKQQFYKSTYMPSNLRSDEAPNFFKSHLGNWQLDIENYIYRATGIRRNQINHTQTLNFPAQASCVLCGEFTQERWLNSDGICTSCNGNQVRRR
jgi:hypothetical protein